MLLSNRFEHVAANDGSNVAYMVQETFRAEKDWSREERVTFFLKLIDSRFKWHVRHSLAELASYELGYEEQDPRAVDPIRALIRIADGPDEALAGEAMSWLAEVPRHALKDQFLRRRMTDKDPKVALTAATWTFHRSDGSGFDFTLRHLNHPSPELRCQAIDALDFQDAGVQRVGHILQPIFLKQLKMDDDVDVIKTTIMALRMYPSDEVLQAIKPFQRHENKSVQLQAIRVSEIISRKLTVKANPNK